MSSAIWNNNTHQYHNARACPWKRENQGHFLYDIRECLMSAKYCQILVHLYILITSIELLLGKQCTVYQTNIGERSETFHSKRRCRITHLCPLILKPHLHHSNTKTCFGGELFANLSVRRQRFCKTLNIN